MTTLGQAFRSVFSNNSRRLGRSFLAAAGVLTVLVSRESVVAATAPTIAIASPTSGVPASPTTAIRIVYSGDGLNLSTLRIVVRGEDWTSRFTVSGTEAVFQPTVDAPLIAGALTIQASISNAAMESSTVSTNVSVAPSFTALDPVSGGVGLLIEVRGVGLDPSPQANEIVMFQAGTQPTVTTPFQEIAPDGKSGKVKIPPAALSGPVVLRVNGVYSPEAIHFNVKTVLPQCGDVADFDFAVNGDIYATFNLRDNGAALWRDPVCPAPSSSTVQMYAVRVQGSDGTVTKLIESSSTVAIVGSAVDKSGRIGAFLTRAGTSGNHKWQVRWWKDGGARETVTITGIEPAGCCSVQNVLDFDRDTRFYFMYSSRLARVSLPGEEAIPIPGTDRPLEYVGPPNTAPFPHSQLFAIGCDNRAYLVSHFNNTAPPNYVDYKISQIDVETGARTAEALVSQRYAWDIDVGCDTGKVYVSHFRKAWNYPLEVELATVTVAQDPPSIQAPSVLYEINGATDNPLIRLGPDGSIYTSNNDRSTGYRTRPGGGRTLVKVNTPPVQGCDGGALAICPRNSDKLEILSGAADGPPLERGTTRWKSQRSDAPIKVVFKGPSVLDVSSVKLEVTAPGGIGTYTPTIGSVSRITETTDRYEFEWLGPWTYPMQTGNVVEQAPLPGGNYVLVIKGKRNTDAPELTSPAYDKVSLVAVTGVVMTGHLVGLGNNTNTGLGKRIFPEATQPAPNDKIDDRDLVKIVVQTSPVIADGLQPPVTVAIRAIDVDDPSAMDDDVDSEKQPVDNRGDNEPGVGLFDPSQPALVNRVDSILVTQVGQTGQSTAFLRVSKHPGDNYRVAASLDGVALAGFTPVSRSATGEVATGAGAVVSGGITELLTVWRTLHVEMSRLVPADSAADQARMDVRGNFSKLFSNILEDASGPFLNKDSDRAILDDWVLHNRIDDWAGADLRVLFHPSDSYSVLGSAEDLLGAGVEPGKPNLLNGQADANISDRRYVVRDDDVSALGGVLPMGLASSLLRSVYVEPNILVESEIAFTISVDPQKDRRHNTSVSNYTLVSNGPSSPAFWSVSLTAAFDSDPDSDQDPYGEFQPGPPPGKPSAVFGRTTRAQYFQDGILKGAGKPRASVFLETIRDVTSKPGALFGGLVAAETLKERVVAHELLHTLSVPHPLALETNIMCSPSLARPGSDGATPSAAQRSLIRALVEPVPSVSPQKSCQ